MQKTLAHLINKIHDNQNGTLSGGFASIKGGLTNLVGTNEQDCTNKRCSSTNLNVCTNTTSCENTTNKTHGCTNEFMCII